MQNTKREGKRIYTKNLFPGKKVYGEDLVSFDDEEYREWTPFRSKLSAALLKGIKGLEIKEDMKILYLGAAQGTTVSHLSDIVTKGEIYCIEIASKPFEKLLALCELRENLFPILEDANHPENYEEVVEEVDLVYQDIAQRNQAEIFVKNIKKYLKKGGQGFIMIKARSIDVSADTKDIFEKQLKEIELAGLKIEEKVDLRPFDKDHIAVLVRN